MAENNYVRSSVVIPPVVPLAKKPDSEQAAARTALLELFEAERERVFYSRQLEIMFEHRWFHWITNRALRELIAEGEVTRESRALASGTTVHLVWHKSYRYPRRSASRVLALVDEYSHHDVSADLGRHGEALVLEGFARHQFVMIGRDTRSYRGQTWADTNNDVDFIFERDGVGYGVEVKNQLTYLPHGLLERKVNLCLGLGLRPVLAVRMLPKEWTNEVINAGGYAMIMKFQMYPKYRQDLVDRMRDELGFPVDTPERLLDGTMQRFLGWHAKNV
jgi:hypothetical protein